MDTALVLHRQTIIIKGSVKIEVLSLRSGQLAAVNLLVPDQLRTGEAHLGQQEAEAHAGLIVLVVGNGGHGVQAGPIGGAEADAHGIHDAGQLVDDAEDLAEGTGVDVELVQQVQQFLGAEEAHAARPR